MSSSVGFSIPFLSTPSKKKSLRKYDDDCSNLLNSSIEESELDASFLYSANSPSSSSTSSMYDHFYLNNKYAGNPLLQYADDDRSYTSSRSLTSHESVVDEPEEMMVWNCQYCVSAMFRTEHEAMIHELVCACNVSGPLVKNDTLTISPNNNNEKRGRHVARLLLQKSAANSADNISSSKQIKHNYWRKKKNKNTQVGKSNKAKELLVEKNILVTSRRDYDHVSSGKVQHAQVNKKKGKNQITRTVRKLYRNNRKKSKKDVDRKGSSLDEYFSLQQAPSNDSGYTSVITDDITTNTGETYDMSETPRSDTLCGDPFRESRQPKPITSLRPIVEKRSSKISKNDSFSQKEEHLKSKKSGNKNIKSRLKMSIVDRIPPSLCKRPTSEEMMDQLGLKSEAARFAVETLRSRPCTSSADDDLSANSLGCSSTKSWDEEEIQGIVVPNYAEYVDMAVTAFRRDVLNIGDDLYLSLQSVAYRIIPSLENNVMR
eukprot:CAMPEP_0197829826 /NCGR_PEP_ID=MMETSP1437-20131217/6374_1 /TAXON_ID=49252 ORGANISM="Eucampia antarctica, Strain CCMP1452" /NCGR_SAMPLE_ID=MMETSP1437 /ASSEMBLY_ACC=CAM_ASM_001096 /LENGTH=486 /DNA_ID=CAMNT_0043431807 /DNA_START=227 /DNA_END=1687 /DNA_ORIENTATION=+